MSQKICADEFGIFVTTSLLQCCLLVAKSVWLLHQTQCEWLFIGCGGKYLEKKNIFLLGRKTDRKEGKIFWKWKYFATSVWLLHQTQCKWLVMGCAFCPWSPNDPRPQSPFEILQTPILATKFGNWARTPFIGTREHIVYLLINILVLHSLCTKKLEEETKPCTTVRNSDNLEYWPVTWYIWNYDGHHFQFAIVAPACFIRKCRQLWFHLGFCNFCKLLLSLVYGFCKFAKCCSQSFFCKSYTLSKWIFFGKLLFSISSLVNFANSHFISFSS